MQIGGLQKLTLLDYPGKVACTVFLYGCNFRCPFCHNTPLVTKPHEAFMSDEEFFAFLKERSKILEGVCISGGEPLLQKDIISFISQIKEAGYFVKLDTNGSFPDRLKQLIDGKLIDYVAMDIKNSPSKYSLTAGTNEDLLCSVKESVNIIKSCGIEYEFRTTVTNELFTDDDFIEIGKWLCNADKYFLQGFIDSGNILTDGLSAPSTEKLKKHLDTVKKYIPNAQLRGI